MSDAEEEFMGWLIRLYLRHPESDLSAHPNAEVRALYAFWQAHLIPLGVLPSAEGERELDTEYGDDEDALEQLYRLWAIRQVVPDANIWVRLAGQIRNLSTGETFDGDISELHTYGPLTRFESDPADTAADEYASLRAFQGNAGRKTLLCGFEADSGHDLVGFLRAHRGHRVFVKVNRAKYGIPHLDVPEDADDARLTDLALFDEQLGGAMIHLEGRPGAFIAQEWVPMRDEYRLFIVDGAPVTGAGCIVEFTPADRVPGRAFDTRVRVGRGIAGGELDDTVREDSALVDAYVRFGARVAAEIAAEDPRLTEYVMDVACGADGRPMVIELNGLPNSGLYASDPSLVLRALAQR